MTDYMDRLRKLRVEVDVEPSELLVKKVMHGDDVLFPEREKWMLRLVSIGFTAERAVALEKHWFTTYRTLGGPDVPDDYRAFCCPLFEKLWSATR